MCCFVVLVVGERGFFLKDFRGGPSPSMDPSTQGSFFSFFFLFLFSFFFLFLFSFFFLFLFSFFLSFFSFSFFHSFQSSPSPPFSPPLHTTDKWTVREQLVLLHAVSKFGETSWVQVGRSLRHHSQMERPTSFYSQKVFFLFFFILILTFFFFFFFFCFLFLCLLLFLFLFPPK